MKNFIYSISQLGILLAFCCSICASASAVGSGAGSAVEQFKQAWGAARRGDHVSFGQIKQNLDTYLLYPYLQYEDYRNRRANIPAQEMAAFLASHQGWAFTTGLRNAWLALLAHAGRWADLVAHAGDIHDTTLRCQRARGQIALRQTIAQMVRVPDGFRDSQLLEWWARFLLSERAWDELGAVIAQMPEETRSDERWRYWLAQAESRTGNPRASTMRLKTLALEVNYYGFLAADELGLAYNICPLQATVDSRSIERIAGLDGFKRALELRKAGLGEWAVREWSLAMGRLEVAEIKTGAALAHREDWHDRVIFALGNSGDLRFYDLRFPLLWMTEIKHEAAINLLDPAWVYGTIRAESAMQVSARSSANALGLMQVTSATGRQLAKKHGFKWRGNAGLMTVTDNLRLGTAYMHDLMQRYNHNPVLVSGAYNAGPALVQRWLEKRPGGEAAIWVETLPFFETRNYIPRVLAFTTLYEWRLGGAVQRMSARMPHLESGKIRFDGTAKVVCRDQAEEQG